MSTGKLEITTNEVVEQFVQSRIGSEGQKPCKKGEDFMKATTCTAKDMNLFQVRFMIHLAVLQTQRDHQNSKFVD